MDKTTVQQYALDLLGNRTLRKETASYEALQRHYDTTIRFCCEQSDWSFARRVAILRAEADGTFLLPIDCLRMRELRIRGTIKKLPSWKLIGRRIHPEHPCATELELTYTCDYTLTEGQELPDSSPTFCRYVITLLAARIAPSVVGELALELAPQLEAQANAMRLQAIAYDMSQSHSNDQSPFRGVLDMLKNP